MKLDKKIIKNYIITKIKKYTAFYSVIRSIFYFLFENKIIGKIIWSLKRFFKSSKLFYYEPCLCKNNYYTVYLNFGKNKLLACSKCGLIRNFPMPDNGVYEKEESIEYENNSDLSIQIKGVSNSLKSISALDIKILDFGCGDGRNMSFLRESGFKNIYGLEISDYLSAKARCRNFTVFKSIDEVPSDLFFDCVISSHVFEHILDLNMVLCKIRKIMKSNALLISLVPNIRSSSMNNIYAKLIWNSHYWQFNPQTFCNILTNNYFKIYKNYTMSDKFNKNLKIIKPSLDGNEGDAVCVFAKK